MMKNLLKICAGAIMVMALSGCFGAKATSSSGRGGEVVGVGGGIVDSGNFIAGNENVGDFDGAAGLEDVDVRDNQISGHFFPSDSKIWKRRESRKTGGASNKFTP